MENNTMPPTTTPQPTLSSPTPSVVPEQPKLKMKLWKKILLTLIIILVLIGLAFYKLPLILTLLHPGDAVLTDNSQLLLQPVSVSDQDNGFFDLNNITSGMITLPASEPSFDLDYTNYNTTTPVQWNQQLVNQVLQANQQALSLFSQAASKNNFQIPDYADPAKVDSNLTLYPMNQWRTAARLEAIQALSLSYQGQTGEALQTAANLNKVGHEIIIGHNSLIGTLVGISMQELGSETILQILPYGSSSTSSLQSVLQLVKNSSNNLAGYKDAYRFEYTKEINDLDEMNQQLSSAIENLVQQGANPSLANYAKYGYYYKPNQTKNLYTNLYNTELAGVGVECNLSSLEQQSTQSQFEPSRVIFEENAIGQMLYAITGLGEGGVLTTECQNDLVANIAQIELALKGYKLDNGSLPASLDSLTPQYLTSVPLDPFDQQPVSYSAGKKILYSVGINKQDLGGSQGINWMQMDNPTFQINF